MHLPLLVKPDSVLIMTSQVNSPESDFTKHPLIHLYEVSSSHETRLYDAHHQVIGSVTTSVENQRIKVELHNISEATGIIHGTRKEEYHLHEGMNIIEI